ncbi:MAG: hypothetical protein Q9Q40_01300 [Acidobacteriota bacterium]|nr:hypothetical protein [Acidobacteriota bacterium]
MKAAFPSGLVIAVLAFGLLALAGCSPAGKAPPVSGPAFFPPPPDAPRLQFLTAITSDADLPGARRGLSAVLLGGKPLKELTRPRGIAVHDGVIFIADSSLRTVIKIDLAAGLFDHIDDKGGGKLAGPSGLAFADDGTLYVADVMRRQVMVYAPGDQHFLTAIGDPETLRPTDVAVRGDRLYVSDIHDHEIEVYDRLKLKRVGTIGGEGSSPGTFKYPSFLTIGADGALYVCDSMNFRVQKLTPEGEFLASYGSAGDWTGNLARPKGIAVDEDGLLHVLDAAFENAQIFLPDGQPATVYGGYGNFEGHMYLPFEITLDTSLLPYFRARIDPRIIPRYLVLVTNQAGPHKLNIYAFGEPAGGAGQPAEEGAGETVEAAETETHP